MNVKQRLTESFSSAVLFIRLFLFGDFDVKASFTHSFNMGMPVTSLTNKRGGGGSTGSGHGMLAIIAAGVGGTFGFLFLLIIGGQIGGTSGIYGNLPASNISAITGNIGKAVVTGSQFVVLIFLGAGVAVSAAMIFLALAVFRGRGN